MLQKMNLSVDYSADLSDDNLLVLYDTIPEHLVFEAERRPSDDTLIIENIMETLSDVMELRGL